MSIFEGMGISIDVLIIILFILVIALVVAVISLNMKCSRLKNSYYTFMRGKDGKTLERSMGEKFKKLEELVANCNRNQQEIRSIRKAMQKNYQKIGIVKYDAFHEMGGKLSFVLTLLDAKDNGFCMNVMHSRDGCYTYIKEIVLGKSYVELSEEEAESLERAIYQETYGLDKGIGDIEIKTTNEE